MGVDGKQWGERRERGGEEVRLDVKIGKEETRGKGGESFSQRVTGVVLIF